MKTHRFFSVFLLLILAVSLLTGPASAAEVPDPAIQAKAALLVDANTGRMVYGKNEHEELYPASLTKIMTAHERLYPASLTKVMTALLILEKVSGNETLLNQEVTASESAFSDTYYHADGSSAGIKAGEVMTVKQLLQCMLIVSANEACNILAEQVSGSVDAFVGAMNEKAAALGCENTHFVNTTGLHDSQHYTSAWDLYLITKAAMQYPEFMEICDSAKAVIPAGTYNNTEDVEGLFVYNIMLVRKDLSDDMVYDMLQGIFENISTIKASHNAADKNIDISFGVDDIQLPLHPGAEAFWRDNPPIA